jgi:nitrate/nitrite-specific signal transduction histidine kinase
MFTTKRQYASGDVKDFCHNMEELIQKFDLSANNVSTLAKINFNIVLLTLLSSELFLSRFAYHIERGWKRVLCGADI